MSIAQSKAAVVERVERRYIVLLIDVMTLSFPPKALDAGIWSCRRVVMDPTER